MAHGVTGHAFWNGGFADRVFHLRGETTDLSLYQSNDLKLSDCPARRDGCAGEGGGAAGVTRGAVRSSAWLGVAVEFMDAPNLYNP